MRNMFQLIVAMMIISASAGAYESRLRGVLGKSLSYVCYRTESAINVDGSADDASWKMAAWTEAFVDIQGGMMPKPRLRTRAKMLWDDHYFYVLLEMQEPDLWATYKKRDSVIFHENDIEMFIDPDGDTHHYYELEVNALGTVWDLMLLRPYRDAGGAGVAVNAWDMHGMKTAVKLHGSLNDARDRDVGWVLELAIPWQVLTESLGKKQPEAGDQWRVNFSRVQWALEVKNGKYVKQKDQKTGKAKAEDNWVWSPQGAVNMHLPECWGRVQFSRIVVGTGTEKFTPRRVDMLKDVLRRVYYAQATHYQRSGSYAKRLEQLMGKKFVQQWGENLTMRRDAAGYRAILNDGQLEVAIDQTGRVWNVNHKGKE